MSGVNAINNIVMNFPNQLLKDIIKLNYVP